MLEDQFAIPFLPAQASFYIEINRSSHWAQDVDLWQVRWRCVLRLDSSTEISLDALWILHFSCGLQSARFISRQIFTLIFGLFLMCKFATLNDCSGCFLHYASGYHYSGLKACDFWSCKCLKCIWQLQPFCNNDFVWWIISVVGINHSFFVRWHFKDERMGNKLVLFNW